MRIVTCGSHYLDIDGYGGCVAYAELLQMIGVQARAVSTAVLNDSVPQVVRDWGAPLATNYTPSPEDTYTLVDISNPDYFEKFVAQDRIDEVIDHRPGFEKYWEERIGDGALIEHVGAACTQVFEQWEVAGLAEQMSETSARLLMCGILDNTLNFGAAITTERDKKAYAALAKVANLPDDWPKQYFDACQESILQDIGQASKDDTKMLDFKTYPRTLAISQLTVWDAEDVIQNSFDVFKKNVERYKPDWAMNIIGVEKGASYFVTDVQEVKDWLEKLLGVRFEGNMAVADRMWLRKEIMRADIDKS